MKPQQINLFDPAYQPSLFGGEKHKLQPGTAVIFTDSNSPYTHAGIIIERPWWFSGRQWAYYVQIEPGVVIGAKSSEVQEGEDPGELPCPGTPHPPPPHPPEAATIPATDQAWQMLQYDLRQRAFNQRRKR